MNDWIMLIIFIFIAGVDDTGAVPFKNTALVAADGKVSIGVASLGRCRGGRGGRSTGTCCG